MLIKWIGMYFIRRACSKVANADSKDYKEIQRTLFKEISMWERESNDSTVYAWMLSEFNRASMIYLKHVSKDLRSDNEAIINDRRAKVCERRSSAPYKVKGEKNV